MVVKRINDQDMYYDGFLLKDLDFVKQKVLKGKHMFLLLIDGRTGSGKSTLACQIAYYLNPDITLDCECFSRNQFEEQITTCRKGDVAILDEAFFCMNKRRSLSIENMQVLSLLQQVRLKQAFVIICLPSVFDLDKNVILNLADLFIHTYTHAPYGRRGRFSLYERAELRKLWLYARQDYSYPLKIAKPQYRGRFTAKFPLDYDEYEKKKLETLKAENEKNIPDFNRGILQRNELIFDLYKKGETPQEIGDKIGLGVRQVQDVIKRMRAD